MADDNATGGGEKNLDPTDKKLADARMKGDIPRSADLSAAASFLGFALMLSLFGKEMTNTAASALIGAFQNTVGLSHTMLGPGGRGVTLIFVIDALRGLVPLVALPAALVVAVVFAQQGWSFSLEKLAPKASRISPLSVAKNRFGPTGLFEFAKSFLKLLVFGAALAVYLIYNAEEILSAIAFAPQIGVAMLGKQLVAFLTAVFVIAAAVAVLDYFWQVYDHRRKLMMSRQEVVDESKESEGDPHLKQERRQRGMDIATQRMLGDVPMADVIIVNPEHYAVALKWNRDSAGAPVCVAKGVDHIAARIREIARDTDIPIHRDPPTARAIFASVAIGDEVLSEHYRAVAAAIRFAEAARALKTGRSR